MKFDGLLDALRKPADGQRRVPQQISRLLIVFAVAIAALLIMRRVMIPATFGQLGHYRAASIGENAARPIKYAGRGACNECHDDIVTIHSRARHQTVSCEACHGAAQAHIASGGEIKPVVPRERAFCPKCHAYDAARPTGFPQIDPVTHNPVKRCVTCHNPHEPVPPNVPTSCSACHAEIAKVKAVSPHAELPCVRCHETNDSHLDTPRLSRPTKPLAREFCGGCHAKGATSAKEIPRIDLATHGRNYLCWQCHYPHDPEVS
jgi:hypothetical protein